MKKLIIAALALASINVFAIDAEIISNTPATIHNQQSIADGLSNLQSILQQLSNAQTSVQQLAALKNLQNIQSNPGATVQQVNQAVSGLVNNFNLTSGTSFNNLSQLVNSIAGATTSEGMNIKLMQSSITVLAGIQGSLNNIQQQNNAMMAFKQAEENQHQAAQVAAQQQNDKTAQVFSGM